jgi:hypothetical protein
MHIVWAAGWHVGLRAEDAQKAFAQPWFIAYDVLVAGICALAVPVALALVQPWGRRVPRGLVGFFAWGGTALLVLRGGASIIQALHNVFNGRFVAGPMHLWEVWFYVGAVLFAVSTWRFWSERGTAQLPHYLPDGSQ